MLIIKDMKPSQQKQLSTLISAMLISVAIHFSIASIVGINFSSNTESLFELQKIDKIQLSKIKSKFKKFGNPASNKENISAKVPNKSRKMLDLSALKMSSTLLKTSKIKKSLPGRIEKLTHPKAISYMSLNRKNIRSFLKNSSHASGLQIENLDPIMAKSDFQISLDLPKGVKLNQLNKKELKFYGFQQRTISSYISSVYKAFNQFSMKNPHINLTRDSDTHKMTGRVQFDKSGNINAIKIIKYSNQKKIREFFIDVLEGIHIPNPPTMILNEDDKFAYYFTLILNS